jgi:alpha-L-fucosidase
MKLNLLLLLLAGLCVAPALAPAQSSDHATPAPRPAALTDPWAPTHGVKSAEQIDKEWQNSVSKFEARRDALLKLADQQAHDGPYRPDWETLRNHDVPQWFKDAKFGIFIGWGVLCRPRRGQRVVPA